MRIILPAIFICFLSTNVLFSQNTLALENMRKFKRVKFAQGETFIFKTESNKKWLSGQIGEVYDSSFILVKTVTYLDGDVERKTVFKDEIPMANIQYIKFPEGLNGKASGIGPIAFWGGIALIGIFGVNRALVGSGEEAEFDGTSFIIAGGLSLTGLVLMLSRNKKVRVKGNWKLVSMPPMTPLIKEEGPQ